ncbi:MAG: helix-turn-helix transcriptional regulator [Candidatus Eremiobacteraeota bacterium]|nr:helix-turn-helix transcriptional regulator [Candidatus Eremiobacteraeota bacterium]
MLDERSFEAMENNLRVLDGRARDLAAALSDFHSARRRRSDARIAPLPELTARQVAILRLIAAGKDNTAIARELHYGLGTIKLHVREILEALRVPTRAAAAVTAVRLGLI